MRDKLFHYFYQATKYQMHHSEGQERRTQPGKVGSASSEGSKGIDESGGWLCQELWLWASECTSYTTPRSAWPTEPQYVTPHICCHHCLSHTACCHSRHTLPHKIPIMSFRLCSTTLEIMYGTLQIFAAELRITLPLLLFTFVDTNHTCLLWTKVYAWKYYITCWISSCMI